jgi:hypothetical protein
MQHRGTLIGVLATVVVGLATLGAPTVSARSALPSNWTTGANVTDWSTDGYKQARGVLEAARADGITSVSLVPTLYMDDPADSTVARDPQRTPSDDSLRDAATEARSLGLQVTIKPHVDVLDGSYRGDIQPADRGAWFASYGELLNHYAMLAHDVGARTVVIGTELDSMVGDRAEWASMIATARTAFPGTLTYAANWGVVGDVPFWDQLDEIGVDAYLPLGDANTSPAQLRAAWQPLVGELSALHDRTGKPVIFTELGYQSRTDGLRTPYAATGASDEGVQARGYDAAFAVWSAFPWFRGISWWDFPVRPGASSAHDGEFSPRGKAAEQVLRRRTGATGQTPAPGAAAAPKRSIVIWLVALGVAAVAAALFVLRLRRRSPDVGVRVPALRVPAIPRPSLRVPAIPRPSLRVPAIPRPSLRVPTIPRPSLRVPAIRVPAIPRPSLRLPLVVRPIVRAPAIRRLVTRRRADGGSAQPLPGSPALVEGGVDDIVDPVRMACLLAGPELEPLLVQARFVLDAHSVVLFLRDPHDGTVVHVAMAVGVPEDLVGRQLSSADGLMGHVLQTGNPISVADRSQLPDAIAHPLVGDVNAALSVPVRLSGRVTGALTVGRAEPFAPSERHLLSPVADAIAELLPPWLIGASWPNEPQTVPEVLPEVVAPDA